MCLYQGAREFFFRQQKPSTLLARYTKHLCNSLFTAWLLLYVPPSLTLISLRLDSVEITNKMQPCIRIYYSTVHWRLNMFRVAYRSSSGALTVFAASGLHTHVVTGRSQVWVGVPTQTWLRPVTTCVCKPEAANTDRAPDDERYAARNLLSLQWTVE